MKISELEIQNTEIIRQHLELIKQIRQISTVQAEMTKQIVKQHEDTETLLKALGIQKDLSYYSFDLCNEEGH